MHCLRAAGSKKEVFLPKSIWLSRHFLVLPRWQVTTTSDGEWTRRLHDSQAHSTMAHKTSRDWTNVASLKLYNICKDFEKGSAQERVQYQCLDCDLIIRACDEQIYPTTQALAWLFCVVKICPICTVCLQFDIFWPIKFRWSFEDVKKK
jgi:hypothetical protein